MDQPYVSSDGDTLVMPGMATVHSHAFQRGLRGRTQRKQTQANTFWTWRGLMFALADWLNPDQMLSIARFAYIELALSGITAVGEFHYLHHDRGGRPYADRVALAEAMIQAAKEAGIRITLIRAAYLRAGYQQEFAPGQDRFRDEDIAQSIADTETLRRRHAANPLVNIAVAAHSIRAVPLADITALARYAAENDMPFHMHVSEQRREIAECQAEYGMNPVELLAQHGILSERFTAIHATHLTDAEIAQLGAARAFIGICRTTERDLGDGTPQLAALLRAGGRLCYGVDSHASGDAFEEMRAAELDLRPVNEQRHVAAEAPLLLDAATRAGYASIGMPDAWRDDRVWLTAADPSIAGADPKLLTDAVVFGATPRAVARVTVGDKVIIDGGRHPGYAAAATSFIQTMREVLA